MLDQILSELLMDDEIIEGAENPTEVFRFTRNGEEFLCYLDGGDWEDPGIIFARWVGEEHHRNITLRTHIPDRTIMDRNDAGLRDYLSTIIDNRAVWFSVNPIELTITFDSAELLDAFMSWMCDGGGESECYDAIGRTHYDYDFNKRTMTISQTE